jgi:hypothetical protein
MRRTGTRSASAIVLLACLTGCGARWEAGPRARSRTLPAYAGHDAELFEDGIEPGALGYEATLTGLKETDRLLAARTQASDGVVRARVVTVTSKREETGPSLQLGRRNLEKTAGRRG